MLNSKIPVNKGKAAPAADLGAQLANGPLPSCHVQHCFAWLHLRYLVGFGHPASGRTCFHLATTVGIPVFEVELAEFTRFARQTGASPTKQIVPSRLCWCSIGRGGQKSIPPSISGSLTTSTCSCCSRTLRSRRPPNISGH